jgi:hypothetical integral membrane protein (TIGR02206 family)
MAGWEHLGAVAVAASLCAALCAAARARPGPWTSVAARALAVLLVGNLVAWQVVTAAQGRWTVHTGLMLDLCPVSAATAATALWTRRPLLAELAYFWGCAGSVQGLITPDTRWHFPNFFYFQFYVIHAGVVVAGLFLVIGLGLVPRPHAVRRVFALTLAFAGVCAVADIITGGNYMFLRDTGGGGTLLEVMGPWPWYIATGMGLALLLLVLLDAPFRHGGLRRSTEPFRPTTPR